MLTLERLIPSREAGARQNNIKVSHTAILHEILFTTPKYKHFLQFCTQVVDKSIYFLCVINIKLDMDF